MTHRYQGYSEALILVLCKFVIFFGATFRFVFFKIFSSKRVLKSFKTNQDNGFVYQDLWNLIISLLLIFTLFLGSIAIIN